MKHEQESQMKNAFNLLKSQWREKNKEILKLQPHDNKTKLVHTFNNIIDKDISSIFSEDSASPQEITRNIRNVFGGFVKISEISNSNDINTIKKYLENIEEDFSELCNFGEIFSFLEQHNNTEYEQKVNEQIKQFINAHFKLCLDKNSDNDYQNPYCWANILTIAQYLINKQEIPFNDLDTITERLHNAATHEDLIDFPQGIFNYNPILN